MFERYTENARRALFFARYETSQLGDLEITIADIRQRVRALERQLDR